MAKLKKRFLGSTGIKISALGLGTVKLGRDQEVKYPNGFVIPNDKEVRSLLEYSKELGINFIDTAPAYGNSEERLGQLMANPNDWVIMTKVGEIFENGKSTFDFSAEHTRMSVERSLKRLNRESLDMVLVHSNGDDMNIINNTGALEELDKLKNKGLIQSYGMSTKTVQGGMWVVENTDIVMATLNLSDHHDLGVIEHAAKLNKGVVIKKGLQSGHADKSAGGGGVKQAFEYIFSHDGVSSVIVGTINQKHLSDNVEIVSEVCK